MHYHETRFFHQKNSCHRKNQSNSKFHPSSPRLQMFQEATSNCRCFRRVPDFGKSERGKGKRLLDEISPLAFSPSFTLFLRLKQNKNTANFALQDIRKYLFHLLRQKCQILKKGFLFVASVAKFVEVEQKIHAKQHVRTNFLLLKALLSKLFKQLANLTPLNYRRLGRVSRLPPPHPPPNATDLLFIASRSGYFFRPLPLIFRIKSKSE